MPDITERSSDAIRLAKALHDAAGDSETNKRLVQIIRILWKHRVYRSISPEQLVAVLQDLGPTFVKIGQMISARADIFPPEYCDALTKLRTQATPLPFNEIEDTLNKAYGGDYARVFSSLDETPLGSASIAQVHKATLRDSGKVVAVKVRRPHVKEQMLEDIKLLRRANELLEIVGPSDLDAAAFIDQIEETTKNEIDFRAEAVNLHDFHHNLEGCEHISSPEVYDEYTSESVLVMDYIEGVHADDQKAFKAMDIDTKELGNLLTQNFIKQLLQDGLFHADPHTGNIIIKPGPEIVWIDLGMMGRLSETERRLLRRMFFAVGARDARRMKDVLLVWGRPRGEINESQILRQLETMLVRYASSGIQEIDIVSALNDLLALIRGQHIQMPATFATIARSIITFEGTLETLSPDTSIVGAITEYMDDHLLDDFDFDTAIHQDFLRTITTLRDMRDVPAQISEMLDGLLKGETRFQVGVRDLERPLQQLESTIDRMTLGLIIAGLFIGSSLLCTTQMQPVVFNIPLIGFLGYLGALVLSVYVVISSHRSNRK